MALPLPERPRPDTPARPPAPLTEGRYFHKFENVTKRLPLASLAATPEHVDAFKALAHPSRLEVFFTLVKARGELAAGQVQEALDIPGPTLSHHLEQLRRAGPVQARRQG